MKTKISDKFLPTDSIILDMNDYGLIELNQINEWYGTPSSGKTLFGLRAMELANKQGLKGIYYDCPSKLNLKEMENRGINLDKDKPDSLEELFNNIYESIKNGFNFIVVDDYSALPTENELEGQANNDHDQFFRATVIRHGLRRINSLRQKKEVTLVFICSRRIKIGVLFGNPETSTGEEPLRIMAKNVIRFTSLEKPNNKRDEAFWDHPYYNSSNSWGIKIKWKKGSVFNRDENASFIFEMKDDSVSRLWDLFKAGEYIGAIEQRSKNYWIVVNPYGYFGLYDSPFRSKKQLINKLKEGGELDTLEKNIWEIYHHRTTGGYEGEVEVDASWDLDYQKRIKEQSV